MEVVNALGRRKRAIARIFVSEGTGKITINKRDLAEYFPSTILQYVVKQPLNKLGVFCCQELDRVARTFSLGLANVLAIAAPDRIAVGGGVAKMGDELFSRIRRYTEEYAFVADAGHYGIVESRLMDDAVLAGGLL